MKNTIEREIQRVLANMDSQDEKKPEADAETPTSGQDETQIQDIYVLVVRESAEEEAPEDAIESTLAPQETETRKSLDKGAIFASIFFSSLLLSLIALQIFLVLNPPIATVTIIPKSQQISLNTTLQFGRLLPPLTISQEATTPTTGHQHQQARQARGTITFYNGQFQAITVPAGTLLSGSSGVQIATDQQADIPPGNPPMYGQATVSAHAISPGVKGNIAAYDISQVCCASAVLVKNTTPFFNGQNERDYIAVAGRDIDKLSTSLKTTLDQSVRGAFQGQLKNGEALVTPTCKPTVTSDHHIGAEATQVKVTVSETCRGVAYTLDALQTKATALLTRLATQTLGVGYSLIGAVTVSVIQVTITHTMPTLTISSKGTWAYTIDQQEGGKIKRLVEGKLKTDALHVLLALPGVQDAHIEGMADSLRLPTDINQIHIAVAIVYPTPKLQKSPPTPRRGLTALAERPTDTTDAPRHLRSIVRTASLPRLFGVVFLPLPIRTASLPPSSLSARFDPTNPPPSYPTAANRI